jgi:putative peptide zinc metalloprotease protein
MTAPPLGGTPSPTAVTPDGPGGGAGTADAPAAQRAAAIARLPAPAPASGIELLGETRGSGYRRPPALVRRSDGQTIQLTPLLYAVLRAIDGQRGYEQIAMEVSAHTGRTASAADVLYLTQAKLRPFGVLLEPDGSEPEVEKANPLLALRCKFVISDPELTRRVTRPFAALFRPAVVVAFLAAFAWTTWWALFEEGLASGIHQAFYEPGLLLLVFGLTLVSAGFHEFGHAAACRYGGATPGAMGFGLYLIWPAFYTDVTDSYRLGRGGRLRVDLGGLYFNAVFAVATFAVWTWLRADALLLLIVAQVLQMSRQLAPLVRFDGYHILADLIGVPDLFAHIKPTLLGLLPHRWGRGNQHALKPWARAAISLWVLVVVPLLGLLLITLLLVLPRLAATAWDSLAVQFDVLGQNWADRDLAHVGLRILSIVSLSLPVATVTYLLARVAHRSTVRLWAASAGSSWQRTAVGFVGVAAVAGLAWLWWPNGQYVPIEAEERGSIPQLVAPSTVPAAVTVPSPPPTAATTTGGGPQAPAPPPAPSSSGPELAIVLLPRPTEGGTAPPPAAAVRLVVADDESEEATVLEPTEPTEPADPADPWPFPWSEPLPVREGDNRAIVVNTEDGSTVYDVALAFVYIDDGGPVDERNEAFAYASCRDCTSVAVAFQVILIEGQANVIIPVNTAVAANYACDSCRTHALAVQLIATLREAPGDDVLEQIAAVWADLEQLAGVAESLTVEQIYTWIKRAEAEILTILVGAGAEELDSSLAAVADDPATELDATVEDEHADGGDADGAAETPTEPGSGDVSEPRTNVLEEPLEPTAEPNDTTAEASPSPTQGATEPVTEPEDGSAPDDGPSPDGGEPGLEPEPTPTEEPSDEEVSTGP